MAKGTKARKHLEKMKMRKAAKAAKHAKYEALKGTSKKAKRQVVKKKISGNLKHAHAMLNCGNVGCQKCQPMLTGTPQ